MYFLIIYYKTVSHYLQVFYSPWIVYLRTGEVCDLRNFINRSLYFLETYAKSWTKASG